MGNSLKAKVLILKQYSATEICYSFRGGKAKSTGFSSWKSKNLARNINETIIDYDLFMIEHNITRIKISNV